ncbi:MAG: hypothetical protein AAFN00_15630, partial [Cyanobacteria bacterium J06558_2]
ELEHGLMLSDDVLDSIDQELIRLINQNYFPCYDPRRYFSESTRERPYTGLQNIAIYPMGFEPSFCGDDDDTACWMFVSNVSDESFNYFGYDEALLTLVEHYTDCFSHNHPLRLLADVLRYIWKMTGNLWLDSTMEVEEEHILNEFNINLLHGDYVRAKEDLGRLRTFSNWFSKDIDSAKLEIDKAFYQMNQKQ